MKLSSIRLGSKRKTLLIFFVALVLPLIVVTYLGFDTLTERHLTTKNILTSNLWIRGESAINKLEEEMRSLEANILNKEHLQKLYADSRSPEKTCPGGADSIRYPLSFFLLHEDNSIVYPETGPAGNDDLSDSENLTSPFASAFRTAESQEFQHRNFLRASAGYKRCLEIAGNDRERAYALEGLGRTSLQQKDYASASQYYTLLQSAYSSIYNDVGHPYGIIGLLQLYEIRKQTGDERLIIQELLETYEKLKNGCWKLNFSSFGFFSSELENMLDAQLLSGEDTRSLHVYDSLKSKPSAYLADLELFALLENDVIRKIENTQFLNNPVNNPQVHRFISQTDGDWSLISYREYFDFLEGENYTGGLKWNTDSLREHMIPELLDKISSSAGLDISLQKETNSTFISPLIPENSISLSFRSFPLPWKLIIVQPAILNMEKEIRKEMFIYGLMLGIMIILMTLGAILIARDIKREADATNMKTEFVHNVSHELKTPLSLIRLYGETLLIKESLSPAEKKDALQVITKESERLSHMINNILDFSKIEIGRKEFNFQEGDLATAITDTLNSYGYHLEKEGFITNSDIAEDLPLIIFDKEAIERMMINLLSNAIKYSPDEKILSIRLFRDGEHINLQVSDRGMGIASSDLSHIFDRFYRSREKTGSESSGSGLGLTLVKHIMDSHQGSIQVRSDPGKGSSFIMKFPISNLHNPKS